MRRKIPRFPYSLLPTILLLLGAAMFLSRGCRPGAGTNRDASGVESPSDQSAEYEAQAITAIGAGDSRNAQKFLMSAVDERAQGSTLGEAYASVAKELVHKGHPTESVDLLEPASRNIRISWSPLVWAALGDAYKSAGDVARGEAAVARAESAAQSIRAFVPPAASSTADARAAAADRYIQLAAYEIDVKGKPEAAVGPYRSALALIPDDPRIMNNLGELLADTGTSQRDIDEALKLTRAAVAAAPDDGEFLDSYGWALFRKHDLIGALHVLTEAVSADPGEAEIHFHLGTLYAEMGQHDSASLEFSRALALRPDFPEAVKARRSLQPETQLAAPPNPNVSAWLSPAPSPSASASPSASVSAQPSAKPLPVR